MQKATAKALPLKRPGIARFSDDTDSKRSIIHEVLRRDPELRRILVEGTTIRNGERLPDGRRRRGGREREAGSWIVMYLDFVGTKEVNVQPRWKDSRLLDWYDAGFTRKPGYRTVKRRFDELTSREGALLDAVAHIIRIGNKYEGGWLGFDVWGDATEAEDNVRLHHDCQKHEDCARRERAKALKLRREKDPKAPKKLPKGPPLVLERASSLDVRRERHKEAEREIDDESGTEEIVLAPGEYDADEDVQLVREDGRARLRIGGCWYRLRDPDAGVRAYIVDDKVRKFWIGFYNHKVVCKYSGLRIAEGVRSASEPEWVAYPQLMHERVKRVLGRYPRSASGDRGYSLRNVFEFNTANRIISVYPWRKRLHMSDRSQLDCESFDRHGELRCRGCHGPTIRVRFSPYHRVDGDGDARVWVKCAKPEPDCPKGEQVFRCALEPRTILPISRVSELYMALKLSDREYERTHHLARMRNNDSADHHVTRPRTIGAAWQQLHASASVLIDWILAYERNGWLTGSGSRNDEKPQAPDPEVVKKSVERLSLYRQEEGLHNKGERYPGHGRPKPVFRKAAKPAEPTQDDVEQIIDSAEATITERHRRQKADKDSAPHRPRGRQAKPAEETEGELSTHSSAHAPPEDYTDPYGSYEIPF